MAVIAGGGEPEAGADLRLHLRGDDHDVLARHLDSRGGLAQVEIVRNRFGDDGVEAGIIEGLQPVARDWVRVGGRIPPCGNCGALGQSVGHDLRVRRGFGQCAAGKEGSEGKEGRSNCAIWAQEQDANFRVAGADAPQGSRPRNPEFILQDDESHQNGMG